MSGVEASIIRDPRARPTGGTWRGRNILAEDALGEQNRSEEIRPRHSRKGTHGNRGQAAHCRQAAAGGPTRAPESEVNPRSRSRNEHALRHSGREAAAPRPDVAPARTAPAT